MLKTQEKIPVSGVSMSPPSIKSIGIIGSLSLSYTHANQVGNILEDILHRGYHIASGGAIGTDQFVIERLLRIGRSEEGTIYSPWRSYYGFPIKVRAMTRQFKEYGGSIIWGGISGKENHSIVKVALLNRNEKLVDACHGLIAFIDGHSRGSIYTIKKAAERHLSLVVFPFDCHLPEIRNVKWIPLKCGGCWENGYKAVYLSATRSVQMY